MDRPVEEMKNSYKKPQKVIDKLKGLNFSPNRAH
jgi:hypothetical protein